MDASNKAEAAKCNSLSTLRKTTERITEFDAAIINSISLVSLSKTPGKTGA